MTPDDAVPHGSLFHDSVSRRDFLASAAGATAILAGCAPRGPARDDGLDVYVGTYTQDTRSAGVYRFRMDPATGTWRPAGTIMAGPNPSFLAVHPGRRVLYAVNEIVDYEGRPSGAVSALAVDGAAGAAAPGDAALRGRRASRGGAPCYVSLDRTGRFALVANYVGGNVAVLPLAADGTLGEPTAVVQHQGRGPRADRQEGPHAHCVIPDPSNRFVLAADLGIDRILVYRFDPRAGTLVPAAVPSVALRPGAGPRHLAFHPSGAFLYVVNELDLTLGAFRYDAAAGALLALQTVPLLRGPAAGDSSAADLHVAPSGRFVYASVRGADRIVVFAIDRATGALTPVEDVAAGGHWPRNFALDPSGRFLFVANQRSNTIVGFRVDPDTGRLAPSGQRLEVPAPVCIRFAAGGAVG